MSRTDKTADEILESSVTVKAAKIEALHRAYFEGNKSVFLDYQRLELLLPDWRHYLLHAGFKRYDDGGVINKLTIFKPKSNEQH